MTTIKAKVSLAFIQDNPTGKVKFGNDVINGFTTHNKVFPSPKVPVAQLTDMNSNLSGGITEAATGNFSARKGLEKLVKLWNEGFRSNAGYVEDIANGDKQVIAQSDCKSTRTEPDHIKEPGAADKFELVPENEPGSFGVKSHVAGAAAYLFLALPDGATAQQDHDMIVLTVDGKKIYLMTGTHSNVHFSNVDSGTPLTVQVTGFNLAGNGLLSAPLKARP